ncbi:unnamed protein product, partial [Owenia fusiformis]
MMEDNDRSAYIVKPIIDIQDDQGEQASGTHAIDNEVDISFEMEGLNSGQDVDFDRIDIDENIEKFVQEQNDALSKQNTDAVPEPDKAIETVTGALTESDKASETVTDAPLEPEALSESDKASETVADTPIELAKAIDTVIDAPLEPDKAIETVTEALSESDKASGTVTDA